jgi:V/A-type H+-transporting ATPase subunit K
MENGIILALWGAAIAAVLAGVGSSIGILVSSSKGAGVLAEKPELFGKMLILTALPGSQGVYGLLIAIMILLKAGLFGAEGVLTVEAGSKLLFSGIIIGFAALSSAWAQGRSVAAAMGMVAREEGLAGKAIVMSVLIETYAIFGLLVALLIANSVELTPVVEIINNLPITG